jgi:hypothetical protein
MSNIKYPRTPHLPWSEGKTDDDKTLSSIKHFDGMKLMVTIKMDGENTTMTSDRVYARSVDSADHPSRHWVKSLWSQISYLIPEGWRVCGENLFAKHSIAYENLGSYFHVFNIWNEKNECLSWEETLEWCELLGLKHVEVLVDDVTSDAFPMIHARFLDGYSQSHEGYVVRNRNSFEYKNFSKNVAKYVRANHVQTDSHWMHSELIKNQL